MSSNAEPTRDYIELADSDEEGPGAGRGPAKTTNGVAVSTLAQAIASSSLGVSSPQDGSMRPVEPSGEAGIAAVARLTGPASGAAMLVDPSLPGSSDPMEEIPDNFSAPAAQPREAPLQTTYNGPLPGSDRPLDLTTGVHSLHLPQQPLISRQRWESDDEEESGMGVPLQQQEFRTGLVYSSKMMLHADPKFIDADDDEGIHPEQPERISRIFDALKRGGCVARMKRFPIRNVTKEEVMLVHHQGMWDGILNTSFFSTTELIHQTQALERRFSLYINEHSARCAQLSCGGVIEMCDAVVSGRIRNGFAIVRPPGHHAEPGESMGFCFFNNVAVAARVVKEKYGDQCRKILILDWDVHHGNGTQSAFYEDDEVLYISLHRYEDATFFPCLETGNYDHVGEGKGKGRNVNIPWKDSGMTDADYIAAFQRIVMPIAREFGPDLVIISAGFDAAEGDSLGMCHITPQGYAQMTYDLAGLANGKVVAALEGGYNLDSIARSALSVTEVLLGEVPPPAPSGTAASTVAMDTFREVERVQARYWKSIEQSPYDVVEDDGYQMSSLSIAKLFANHRTYEMGQRYDMDVLPVTLAGQSDDMYTGQVLCSSGLLEEPKDTLIVFAHDAGNLRVEEQSVDVDPGQELGYFLDASSHVVDWAMEKGAGLIDVNVLSQLPTVARMPVSTSSRRGRNPNQSKHPTRLEEARRLLLYTWDNAAVMVMGANPKTKVVLIGLGTATDAIMHLIEERDVESCVKAVVQLPAYSLIPTVPKNNPEKRVWYWKNSRVYLPRDHSYYTFDAQARSGKRLGKLIRSGEFAARRALHCYWY